MALLTLSQIQSRVLHRAHLTTAQFSLTNSASDGQTILRQLINESANIIQGTADFGWARKTFELTTANDKSGLTNPTFYTLPIDWKHELSVVESTQTYPLQPMAWAQYKVLEPIVRAVGKPLFYIYPDAEHMCFYPSPGLAGAGTRLSMRYATKPFVLFDDDAQPNVPEKVADEYFRCLLECCMIEVYKYMPNHEEKVMLAEQYYDRALINLKKASRMYGLIVPALQPQDMTAVYPRATLPTDYPATFGGYRLPGILLLFSSLFQVMS